jgi:hypothetical protein
MPICLAVMSAGRPCSKQSVNGDTLCKLHRTVADRREQARRGQVIWAETIDRLWEGDRITDFAQIRMIPENALHNGWINQHTHDDIILALHDEWMWYRIARIDPTATALTDLQRLALDTQNVHTKEVNAQTTAAQEYLLKTEVPSDQNTLSEMKSAWSAHTGLKKVLRDVTHWYETDFCVGENDFLYKKVLDGLWTRIKQHKERDELTQRLWEEAVESVGMCCQGHLSRLANVLVGFTEEVKAEVPVGEILQQRIAAIAAEDSRVEYKVCEAWSVFEELNIPMEQRDAWIEAF